MPTKIGGAASASTGGSSLTFSATVGAGTNRALVVGVFGGGLSGTPDNRHTVTWNGVSMTRGAASSQADPPSGDLIEFWYLLDASLPAASTTANVVITVTSVDHVMRAGAQTWNGVLQSAPFGASDAATFTDNGSATIFSRTVATASGDKVIDQLSLYREAAVSITPSGTLTWKIDNAAYEVNAGQSDVTATSASTTISWSPSATIAVDQYITNLAAVLRAAPVIGWIGPDLTTAGWTSTAATLWEAIDETTADSADRITSPYLTATVQPYKATLAVTKAAGSYTFSLRAYLLGGTGKVRVRFYSAADVAVGVTADQALTTTETTYAMTVTLTGTATKIQIETVSL